MRETTSRGEIQAARQRSEPALAAIIARHMPMIRHFARRATAPGLDFEDAVQEGLIGLFSAIEHYNESRYASFATYAAVCVQNAISTASKAAGRKKHQPLNQSVPLSDKQTIPGPEDAAIASEQVALTLEKARAMLSPLEKRVLKLYLDGLSYTEIAARTGKSAKAVDNALARVRRKLR